MNYYLEVLKKYAVFNGRASRKEYLMFILINFIIGFVLGFLGSLTGINTDWIINIYTLAILLPSLALAIRRMHDVNKSGWYILIPFYSLILVLTAGTKGDNKYGPDPWGVKSAN